MRMRPRVEKCKQLESLAAPRSFRYLGRPFHQYGDVFLYLYSPSHTDSRGCDGSNRGDRSRKLCSWRFLCVLRVFAVSVLCRINRQDAKSAKKSAKKNPFQAAKDFRVSN